MKTCSRCGIAQPFTNFYRHSRTRDGRQSHCKDCDRKRYREDPERRAQVKASKRRRHLEDSAAMQAQCRRWVAANPERWREIGRLGKQRQRAADPERARETSRLASRKRRALAPRGA
jgi:hypothetical protein